MGRAHAWGTAGHCGRVQALEEEAFPLLPLLVKEIKYGTLCDSTPSTVRQYLPNSIGVWQINFFLPL